MFLHVLAEIRLLRITLAAVLADVRFQVFRLLVLGYVLQEGGLVRKTFVTTVALVWLVRLVAAGM